MSSIIYTITQLISLRIYYKDTSIIYTIRYKYNIYYKDKYNIYYKDKYNIYYKNKYNIYYKDNLKERLWHYLLENPENYKNLCIKSYISSGEGGGPSVPLLITYSFLYYYLPTLSNTSCITLSFKHSISFCFILYLIFVDFLLFTDCGASGHIYTRTRPLIISHMDQHLVGLSE